MQRLPATDFIVLLSTRFFRGWLQVEQSADRALLNPLIQELFKDLNDLMI